MSYRVHDQGRYLGEFSIEELHRKRRTGELSGTEIVWQEGMAEWQPLDQVLAALPVSSGPPPLPAAAPRQRAGTRKALIFAVAAGLVVMIGGGLVAARLIGKSIRGFRAAQQRASGSQGLDVTSRKVTWTTNSATEADARQRAGNFRRRQWIEGYLANGDRNRPCDAEVIQMLEAWITGNFGGQTTNAPDVTAWGDKIAAMPDCEDPLVLTATGANAIELHEKKRRLELALAGFEGSRHKAYPRLYAAVSLIQATTNASDLGRLFNVAGAAMDSCFQDGSFRPEDQAEIADIFVNGWGYNFFYRLGKAVYPMPGRAGKQFEWLALVFEGEYRIMEAWKARGTGYADTVTGQGWEGFTTNSAAARRCFTRAWKLRPDLPLAPARMIYVAMGETDAEEMRLWFDRAVAAQVDYPRAWASMRWGLRPRWHGSHDAMLAFGKAALDTGRFDTDVPRKYFDLLTDLEMELDLPVGEHLYGRSDIWPGLERMYNGYINASLKEQERRGWRSTYSAVAYIAGRYDIARAQLEAIEWRPLPQSLAGWGADLSLLPLEVAARTGAAGAKIEEAEALHDRGRLKEALARYEGLASEGLDARTAQFVKHRIATLGIETRLEAGEWVDLLPSGTNDPAWEFVGGKVRRTAEGLEVESDKHGHMLYSRARMGGSWELRGEFQMVKTSTDDFQAGIVMGLPHPGAAEWYAFRMKRNRDEGELVSYSIGWTSQQAARPVGVGGSNAFQVEFRNGALTAVMNGRRVLDQGKLPVRISTAGFHVGLGAYNDMNDTVIRYSNVQVRKIRATTSN